ncbi:MAG TPA: DUF2752 domain-containing protein [Kribbellaceae bacterium]|nr:DUF2752 domain-containing protein [Kribbellaceae bacterium]
MTAFAPRQAVEPLHRQVKGLAGVGAGGVVLATVYQLSGGRIGVPCPLHTLTGLDCPFCGSTRMAAALLRGDLHAAWGFNAPMLIIGPLVSLFVGYHLVAWLLERAGRARLPRPWPSSRLESRLTIVFMAGMAVFGVLRNL